MGTFSFEGDETEKFRSGELSLIVRRCTFHSITGELFSGDGTSRIRDNGTFNRDKNVSIS